MGIDEKDLRRRVTAAIRSYGISHQDKSDIDSRTDGVMIVLGEYVLPFVRKPKSVAHEPVAYLRDLDGTGSLHVCAKGDNGARGVKYVD